MGLRLVKQAKFGTLVMDFYMDDEKEVFATRKQIGEALGYADAQNGIDKIHLKYRDRFEGKSVTAKLEGTDGKRYDTTLYNSKGIMEICRRARTDKADEFFDWVTDVIDELRTNGVVVSDDATIEQKSYNYNMLDVTFSRTGAEFFMDEYKACIEFHKQNRTRLHYERSSKNRRSDKKLSVAESKIKIMEKILKIAEEREQKYRKEFKWELKSLISEVVKVIKLDIKTVKHNQTKGKLSQANRKIG